MRAAVALRPPRASPQYVTKPRITVVGLGPAGSDLVSEAARDALSNRKSYLRTLRHPAAVLAPEAETFDAIYDAGTTIEGVYGQIVDALVVAADTHGHITYAVPGSPLIAEATVDLLRARQDVDIDVIPALSFLDLAWNALGVDPLATGPRLVDGRRFAVEAAGERGPLLVAQCDAPWVLSDIKLAYEYDTPKEVTVLQRLGLPDESVATIAWEDLDRVVEPDHLTTLWIREVVTPVAFELERVEEVASRLRRDCPWDAKQTHESLGRYLIEESYELLEAIDESTSDPEATDATDAHLIEELGDVLFQVFAHAAIAAEEGRFNIADVAQGVSDKLIERHPHVYGDVVAETAEDVAKTWDANKMEKKGRLSVMEGIPPHLPALLYGWKILGKAYAAGIVPSSDDLPGQTSEQARELFDVASKAVQAGVEPEEGLRNSVRAFMDRFVRFEALVRERELDMANLDEDTRHQLWMASQQS